MPKTLLLLAGLLACVAVGQTRFQDLTPAQQTNLRRVLEATTARRVGTLDVENLVATPLSGSGMLAVYVNLVREDGTSDLVVCSLDGERVWGECVIREGVNLEEALEPPDQEQD